MSVNSHLNARQIEIQTELTTDLHLYAGTLDTAELHDALVGLCSYIAKGLSEGSLPVQNALNLLTGMVTLLGYSPDDHGTTAAPAAQEALPYVLRRMDRAITEMWAAR